MGGGKRNGQHTLQKLFWTPPRVKLCVWCAESWTSAHEKQSTGTWEGRKTYQTKGVQDEDATFLLTVGSFLLTVELFFYFQLTIVVSLLKARAFSLTSLAFFYLQSELFAYRGKVRMISASRDCKQRSLTVSKRAPTVSKKSFPRPKLVLGGVCFVRVSFLSFSFFHPSTWVREIGTICQIGVLTGKRCIFLGPNKGHFQRFRTTFSTNVTQILQFVASLFL